MEPAGKPREILGLCPISPRAKKALLALAATLFFLQFFDYDEGDSLAYRSALRYFYTVSFLRIYARRVMRRNSASTSFIPLIFRNIMEVVALNDYGFIHFGAYNHAF